MALRPEHQRIVETWWPIVWPIVCINLWAFAVLGPIFAVLGVRSFWVDPGTSMQMFGQPVDTTVEKLWWTAIWFVLGALGVRFVVWHVHTLRGRGGKAEGREAEAQPTQGSGEGRRH